MGVRVIGFAPCSAVAAWFESGVAQRVAAKRVAYE